MLQGINENGLTTRVHAEVQLLSGLSQQGIAIDLRSCWATPSIDPYDNPFMLIENGCPKKYGAGFSDVDMAVLIRNSGTNTFARFSFDIFGFVTSNATNLHCIVEVCFGDWCEPVSFFLKLKKINFRNLLVINYNPFCQGLDRIDSF